MQFINIKSCNDIKKKTLVNVKDGLQIIIKSNSWAWGDSTICREFAWVIMRTEFDSPVPTLKNETKPITAIAINTTKTRDNDRFLISLLGKQGQGDSWGFLASQPNLLGDPKTSEKSSLKKKKAKQKQTNPGEDDTQGCPVASVLTSTHVHLDSSLPRPVDSSLPHFLS